MDEGSQKIKRKKKNLEMGKLSCIIWMVQCNHRVFIKEKGDRRVSNVLMGTEAGTFTCWL